MDQKSFNTYCNALPKTETVVQWGGAHVWKVGGKIFAICGPWGEAREDKSPKVSFKCSDMSFRMLTEQEGIVPAPYLGRYKWAQIQQADAMSDGDIKIYIEAAHKLVAAKLTKKVRAELGL